MGAIVDLCDDDDESPCPRITASQQTALQTGKRLFASLAADYVPDKEKDLPGPCTTTGCGVGVGGPHVQDRTKNARESNVLSPIPTADNQPNCRQITNQDKVAARRAVLERRAAERKALKEAAETRRQQAASQQQDPHENATKDQATKEAEVPEKGLKKQKRETEKAEKAARKEQVKTAKAAESRARGSKATEEVTVLLDAALTKNKAKRTILQAFESQDVIFAHRVEDGKLPGWSTITWERSNSSMGASAAVCTVPYIMVVMDDSEAQNLLQSDASVKSFLDCVIKAYGEVSVSLLLISFKRSLVTKDRRNHTHAVRTGDVSAACSTQKNVCLLRLLSLHFRYVGITYRDCHDAQQAAEHVLGITSAIAKQPYKGGDDVLAAFSKKNDDSRLQSTAAAYNLTEMQKTCAMTLCASDWGPKQACAVASRLHTFGAVAQQYNVDPLAASQLLATMKTDTGRNVGPHAANKLKHLLSCEDPDAPYE